MSEHIRSRELFGELCRLLDEVDRRFLGAEWGVGSTTDVADGLRFVIHVLEGGLYTYFESDPGRPDFRRIVSPTRKFTGDNPDAVYFDCPIDPKSTYRIRGNLAGAAYTSFTVEAGAEEGRWGTRTAGILRDDDFGADEDGSYEFAVGGGAATATRLVLPPDAARLTSRHYFERDSPAAADPLLHIPLSIERVPPLRPPGPWDDEAVAAGIQRVINYVRGKTIDQALPAARTPISWVSAEPNVFPRPQPPGDHVYAAVDAYYSLAPYQLGEDEALVITGRWPACRFANVVIWNRFGQTLDYVNRRVSLNRASTALEPDGSFRMIVAHRDPGVPNWMDTEGHHSGSIFWRYFLPSGPVDTPEAVVVPLERLAAGRA